MDGESRGEKARWFEGSARYTDPTNAELPSDSQVVGAVQRNAMPSDVIVCAAGGLPGELHKHWKASQALGYHMEYGYSCMGYEIAGGLGVKMADPSREVVVMVGDGSYLMMNSELATSVMLGLKLTIVLLDNRGYGCINRLQRATGGESFNNLLQHTDHVTLPDIDFAAHAEVSARTPSRSAASPNSRRRWKARARFRYDGHRHRYGSACRHRCGWTLVGCGGSGSLRPAAGEPGPQILRRCSRAAAPGRLTTGKNDK